MDLDLGGRTALVTGGNIGIGRAIALALARHGADVALTYFSHGDGETAAEIERMGRTAADFRMDGADSAEVNRVVGEAAAALGGHLDVVVANAGGIVGRVPIAEMADDHWRSVIDVNLSSTFFTVRAAIPYMNTGWGRIVTMSSQAAENGGGQGSAAYAASKAGILGLTRGLAKELAPRGITVNAVAPGLILQTPFHETFTPEETQRAIVASTPLGRPGVPDDVAGAVLYLVSDLASYVTGNVVDINGGTWFA